MGKAKDARKRRKDKPRNPGRGHSPEPRRSRRRHSSSSHSSNPSSRSDSRGTAHSNSRSRSRSHSPSRLRLRALKFVVRGDARRLRKLLRRKGHLVDLASQDSQGRTLLHHASACGREDVLSLLLRRGAPAGLVDAGGDTPAHLAARAGHLAALAELMRAPDAPALEARGSGGISLRELMGRALGCGAGRLDGNGAQHGPSDNEQQGQEEAEEADEEDRWRQRLREECSDAEAGSGGGGGGDGDWGGGEEGCYGGWHNNSGGGVAGSGETDDEWANRLWRDMQRRRHAAAAAASAAFTTDLRAEAARRAAEAAERSQRILREEKAKDAEWRRRTLAAIEAGPATPPLDLAAARLAYDQRWEALDAMATAAAPPAHQPLRYPDIPWPLEPPPPLGPQAQPPPPPPTYPAPAPSVDALRDFFLFGATGPGDVKRRLRVELLRWHPDKFGARFGARLEAAGAGHRAAVLARVAQLAQVLTQVVAGPPGAQGGGGGGGG